MGTCVPIYVQECLPGDSFRMSTSSMLRMAPLISPVMHKINVYQEFFFVPNRILWKNWETFITGSRNGKQLSSDEMPAFPIIKPYKAGYSSVTGVSSLMDYMGLPPQMTFDGTTQQVNDETEVNALPFAAYQRIWDEYYRDENLVESMYDVTDFFDCYNMLHDGNNGEVNSGIPQQLLSMRPRAWEHDYFTSALPWAQKGEAVRIPVDLEFNEDSNEPSVYRNANTLNPLPNDATANFTGLTLEAGVNGPPTLVDNSANLRSGGTINDLRAAIKLQEWLETNARGGSRYFESIYAHFGVKSPDSRLQRPEFIGSNRSNMIISEVLQTSSPIGEEDTPQGNMSGHGQSVNNSRNFRYYAQEHGYIIGIMSVMPKTSYMQGGERFWWKTGDRLDYYFPEFAHLGEQEILNKEIYLGGPLTEQNEVFGYTPRYSEYKFKNSRVAGDFRDTLKYWHLGRDFADGPRLNDNFVMSGDTISKRIFAVQDIPRTGEGDTGSIRDYDSIYAHVFLDIKASRLMPKYGTPSL